MEQLEILPSAQLTGVPIPSRLLTNVFDAVGLHVSSAGGLRGYGKPNSSSMA